MTRLATVLLAVGALAPSAARAQTNTGKTWVSTWGSGMSNPTDDFTFATTSYNHNDVFADQVVRMIVHVSLGGTQVRVRLSNETGSAPVTVSAAHVALTDTGSNIIAGTDQTLTFNGGSTAVTLPAGAPEVSDTVKMTLPNNANLSVSLYFGTSTTVLCGHPNAQENTYVSAAGNGDVSGAVTLPLDATNPTINQWPLLSGVEVRVQDARTFVAFGSSITNGVLSTTDANARWTDFLSKRLNHHSLPVGVVNASVVANSLAFNGNGGPALARFDRDVLARPGAKYVFINDIIGVEMQQATTLSDADRAQEIITELRQYVIRAHSAGLMAYAGTVIPLGGASNYTPAYNAKRVIINAFIRGGGFDGYADFDAVVADPADPTRILAEYDGGDHHHLNDAGYKLVASTFDLAMFQ